MEIPGYEIERCIGKGGMATAYLARQTSLDRPVVLKVLDSSYCDSSVTTERFLNEGRIVASLQHPNIITTYDIGTAGANIYMSMEYVDGGDLKQRLLEGVFSVGAAIDLVRKIAAALGAAHAKGIVHRDVKPGNILFRGDGTPVLGDFGIAKQLSVDSDLTATGLFVGSPNYMAPEQSEIGAIDGRVDIYALGVILFEILTGRKPYQSVSIIDVIAQHKHDLVPTLPAPFSELQGLLNLMMAKDRNDRFRDTDSLLHYLQQLEDRGALERTVEIQGGADDSSVADWPMPSAPRATRVNLEPQRATRVKVLAAVAALVACIYLGLVILERRFNDATIPPVIPAIAAINADTGKPPTPHPPSAVSDPAELAKVAGALIWLGNHSLNEYRLTAPAEDNAYYYFSRLLRIDPSSEQARQGLLQIAARYAVLAERAIAVNEVELARNYVTIGLQVDPTNSALLMLRDLAVTDKRGVLAALKSVFR